MDLSKVNLQKTLNDKAKELGFIKTGFARAEVLEKEAGYLEMWIEKGYDADMKWIKKNFEKRRDVRKILKNARSVISLAYNYYTPFQHSSTEPKISRYAWGRDYHKILKPKLNELSKFICSLGFQAIAYVDDGPVMDKVWAVKSGIGWMGKHTNVINPEYGSWIFLCEIITDAEFENYNNPVEDMCGECTLCISACPTGALVEEYVLDSKKCISYQTIENKGNIPDEIELDGWIFGCDVCQDICPYNSPRYNQITQDENFMPKTLSMRNFERNSDDNNPYISKLRLSEPNRDILNSITEEQFNRIFADSPVKRTKYKGWKRNLEKLRCSK